MTHRPTAILQTASIRAALATMMELDVRHLPVINEDHELVGMLSDRDLRGLPYLEREINEATDFVVRRPAMDLDAPLSRLMSSDVLSVEPDDDLADALELLLEHKIGAVPVIGPDRRLVGIVSYLDVLRGYQRELTGAAAP